LAAHLAELSCRLDSSTLAFCPKSIRRGSSRLVLASSASSPVHTLQSNWAILHCGKNSSGVHDRLLTDNSSINSTPPSLLVTPLLTIRLFESLRGLPAARMPCGARWYRPRLCPHAAPRVPPFRARRGRPQ